MSMAQTKPVLILLLAVLSFVAFLGPVAPVRAQPSLPVVSVWSNEYAGSIVNDTTLTIGTVFTIEINVEGAPSFNGYELSLYYDPNFLTAQSTDFRTNTVFSNPFVGKNDLSAAGAVSVAVVNLGSSFDGGSGTLMNINFLVKNVGVSPLTLAQGVADPGTGAQSWTRLVLGFSTISVATSDGYFRNDPSRVGPIASFTATIVPNVAGLSQPVIFDASTSIDPENRSGASGGISEYVWDFGDGNAFGTFFPVTMHTYDQGAGLGNFSVRLTVVDQNDGFEGMIAHLVTVRRSEFQPFLVSTIAGSQGNSPIQFTAGGNSKTSVTVQSFVKFPVNVTMTAAVSPTITDGPTVSFAPNPVTSTPNTFSNSFMTISSTLLTPSGNYGVVITGTSGNVSSSTLALLSIVEATSFPEIAVTSYFANLGGHRLPLDSLGNPSVNVVFAHGALRSTNPGQVVAWTNLTNIGASQLGSVRIEDQLPVDWSVSQSNHQSQDAVRVFLQEANGTQVQLSRNITITIGGVRQETLFLTISNTTLALPTTSFDPGDSLLLSVKLDYQLIGTHISPSSFPTGYRSAALGLAWTLPGLGGMMVSATGSGFFIAYARVWGDVNGDSKVSIQDLGLVAFSLGSIPGSPLWNAAANLDGSGVIDIGDLAIVAFNYGDSY